MGCLRRKATLVCTPCKVNLCVIFSARSNEASRNEPSNPAVTPAALKYLPSTTTRLLLWESLQNSEACPAPTGDNQDIKSKRP